MMRIKTENLIKMHQCIMCGMITESKSGVCEVCLLSVKEILAELTLSKIELDTILGALVARTTYATTTKTIRIVAPVIEKVKLVIAYLGDKDTVTVK